MCWGKKTAPPTAGDAGTNSPGCATLPCPVKVTVVINLSLPVACPGHPFALTAVGSPGGGTYAWTVSAGAAELVGDLGTPVSTGASVNLRSFKPEDATGKVPEQNATVSVTYTHPNGIAADSKPVKIHKIEFKVADTTITAGVTQANEAADRVPSGAHRGSTPWSRIRESRSDRK